MARKRKQVELRRVSEDPQKLPTVVIRLESEETLQRTKPIRPAVPDVLPKASHRLLVPSSDEVELRTHQPGIEALIESNIVGPDLLEENWGAEGKQHRQIPWGWFFLIGLLLAGSVTWSLTRVTKSDKKAEKILIATQTTLGDDAKEEKEAIQLIDKIEATTRQFFAATSVGELVQCVRQPERVRPMMEKYYADKPVFAEKLAGIHSLQPITLDLQANFWIASVTLSKKEQKNVFIEIGPDGVPRIDWESYVCYQPMKWDDFAKNRPSGTSMDFRVNLTQDHFFSHEFADSDRWDCFRLSAPNSDEALFGYVKVNSPLANELLEQLRQSQSGSCAMILRLVIPEGLKSHQGVVIEKLVNPRWIFIKPPAPDS